MTISFPATGQEFLLWGHTLVLWALGHYSVTYDSTSFTKRKIAVALRSVLLGGITLILAGFSVTALALAATVMFASLALPLGRIFWVRIDRNVLTEWEITLNSVFVILTAHITAAGNLQVSHFLFELPFTAHRIAIVLFVLSAVLFAGKGGTHIVRGILDRIGTVPQGSAASQTESSIDIDEYNRGRLIGGLERYLLMAAVVLGAYEALALLVAAKGLVRIDDLKTREFAEYFLIGTLSSLLVAFVLGLLLKSVISILW